MEKQYKSVVEMLNDVSDDKDFNKSVENEINTKQIAKTLFAMRCKAGLSQAEIAKKMDCTQGKISKIENSLDVDISVGDLVKYCSAMNMQLEVNFFDRRLTMADKVKYCYFQLKTLLDKIIETAKGDEVMERGVEKFAREAFVNINFGLIECLEKAKVKKEIAAPLHVSTPVNLGEVSSGACEEKTSIAQMAQP
jgi:transcriptional regulator with XRE-family HTH domain